MGERGLQPAEQPARRGERRGFSGSRIHRPRRSDGRRPRGSERRARRPPDRRRGRMVCRAVSVARRPGKPKGPRPPGRRASRLASKGGRNEHRWAIARVHVAILAMRRRETRVPATAPVFCQMVDKERFSRKTRTSSKAAAGCALPRSGLRRDRRRDPATGSRCGTRMPTGIQNAPPPDVPKPTRRGRGREDRREAGSS